MLNSTEHECIMLINVKMPTNVDILTFISMIHTLLRIRKNINFFVFSAFRRFRFKDQFTFYEHEKGGGGRGRY